jgi:hypothetical protein
MKKVLICFTIIFCLSGCSKEHWRAKYYLFKAEQAFEAATRKRNVDKMSHDELRGDYQKACDLFARAYAIDQNVFYLYHIQNGMDACWRSGDGFKQEKLERFEKQYVRDHPKEAEYGDMGLGGLSEG